MGNCDGNTAVDSASMTSLSRNVGKFDIAGRSVLFTPMNEETNPTRSGQKLGILPFTQSSLSSLYFTSVKGQVLTIPASSYANLSEVVDLSVEKLTEVATNRKKTRENSREEGDNHSRSNSCSTNEDENNTILKFGIDSILKTKTKDISENCQLYPANGKSRIDNAKPSIGTRAFTKPTGQTVHQQPCHKLLKEEAMHVSQEMIEKFQSQSSRSFKDLRKPSRHTPHKYRYHPFPNSPFERSHSDPAHSPDNLPVDRSRGRSVSPNHPLFSLNSGFSNRKNSSSSYSFNEINSSRSPSIDSASSSTTRPSSSQDNSRKSENFVRTNFINVLSAESLRQKHPSHPQEQSRGSLDASESFKSGCSDTDEVFKDENDFARSSSVAAKKFYDNLKQKSHCTLPSSPGKPSAMDAQKYGAMVFVPPFAHPFSGMYPTSPTGLNPQSWPGMAPSNCHPMFRHLLNPYIYNQNAMAALAYANSLKSSPPQSMLNPNNPHLNPSLNKNHFSFQGTEGDLNRGDGKKGGKLKRRWTRAVFSILQRRALEDSFKGQKYVAKPERRFLAERLGLTDAQVKIWFQNRRMKWRQEQKNKLSGSSSEILPTSGDENFRQV